MKIVKFNDGTYGLRCASLANLVFGFKLYLYAHLECDDTRCFFYLPRDSAIFDRKCKGSLEQAKAKYYYIAKIKESGSKDIGTPIDLTTYIPDTE